MSLSTPWVIGSPRRYTSEHISEGGFRLGRPKCGRAIPGLRPWTEWKGGALSTSVHLPTSWLQIWYEQLPHTLAALNSPLWWAVPLNCEPKWTLWALGCLRAPCVCVLIFFQGRSHQVVKGPLIGEMLKHYLECQANFLAVWYIALSGRKILSQQQEKCWEN